MKLIKPLFIVVLFASCNSQPSAMQQPAEVDLTPYTNINVYTDALPLPVKAITIVTDRNETSQLVQFTPAPSLEKIDNLRKKEIQVAESPELVAPSTIEEPAVTTTDAATGNTNVFAPDTLSVAPVAPVIVKKENNAWSHATKDAVIGGVGGAIGGAVLSKKKAKGAIIGGIIGAAGGYIFGKARDNKEAEN